MAIIGCEEKFSEFTEFIEINKKGKKNADYIISAIKNKNVVVITCKGEPLKFAEKLIKRILNNSTLKSVNFFNIVRPTISVFNQIKEHVENNNDIIFLAVGGGSCIDIAKALSKNIECKLYVFPTVLSSDCLVSPVSVLIDDVNNDGLKLRLPARNPTGIFVDTKITRKAPRRLTMSGVFDLFSNASAISDLEFNKGKSNSNISYASFLSKSAIECLLNTSDVKTNSNEFQYQLAKGLILSGISMQIAGDSSPASGGEHLISHALDKMNCGNATHGEQVYLGMLCVAEIRKHYKQRLIKTKFFSFLDNLGTSKKLSDYGLTIDDLSRSIILGPSLRTDRATALNLVSDVSTKEISEIISEAFIT